MLQPGDEIGGRFEVLDLLGEGGLAAVWRVRHRTLGSEHALKLLLLRRPAIAQRLLTEGRIQAQLQHPNVVRVTDVVEHEGQVGLLMDYVAGPSLERWLTDHGPADVDTALDLFAAMLSGVRAAHAANVLHRDLKPGNILLSRTSQGLVPKVTDFGIAKIVLEDGTPGYLAPEQASDAGAVDQRADIFALGAILYELLAGRPAFDNAHIDDLLGERAPPLRELLPELPPFVDAAVERALALAPQDRFPDCDAFAVALFGERPDLLARVQTGAATPVGVRPTPARAGLAPPTLLATTGDPTVPRTVAPTPSPTVARDPFATVGALAGIAALVLVVFGGWRMGVTPPPDPQPAAAPPVEAADLALTPKGADAALTAEGADLAATTDGERSADPDGAVANDAADPRADAAASEAAASEAAGPSAGSETPAAPGGAAGARDPSATMRPASAGEPVSPPEPASAPGRATALTPSTPGKASADPAPPPAGEPAATDPVAKPGGDETRDLSAMPIIKALPAPEPAPRAAAPEPALPQVAGEWDGTANGLPVRLRVTRQDGPSLSAEVIFSLGPTQRRHLTSGTIDAEGRIALRDATGELVIRGLVSGRSFEGSYGRDGQKKMLPMSATWSRR